MNTKSFTADDDTCINSLYFDCGPSVHRAGWWSVGTRIVVNRQVSQDAVEAALASQNAPMFDGMLLYPTLQDALAAMVVLDAMAQAIHWQAVA
jgi:hypothetical protein